VAVLPITGQELEGLQFEASLAFPGRIKQLLTKWRAGLPATIGDREMAVLQGTAPAGAVVTLFFDAENGLLARQLRYAESPVGRIPTQIDYSDYRDVNGVKMPFKWTVTWLDGKDSFEVKSVEPNAKIDAARFAKPAAPRN
jgi:hypothetical protein